PTLSARRTAAVVVLSCECFAPPKPWRVAVLGAGPIARAVIEALGDAHPPCEFCVYDLRLERARQLAAELSQTRGLHATAAADPQSCLAGAQILVTATTASKPYVQREWLRDCRVVVALSFEDCVPEVMLSAQKVVVDDFDQCCREEKPLHRLVQAGKFGRERIHAHLGQVLAGSRPGREHQEELVYVNPMGMAIEDVAVAALTYQAAVA